MSDLFKHSIRALASIVTPGTRVIIVLTAESGSEEEGFTMQMRVLDDCGFAPDDVAVVLAAASEMAFDPSTSVEDSPKITALS